MLSWLIARFRDWQDRRALRRALRQLSRGELQAISHAELRRRLRLGRDGE